MTEDMLIMVTVALQNLLQSVIEDVDNQSERLITVVNDAKLVLQMAQKERNGWHD